MGRSRKNEVPGHVYGTTGALILLFMIYLCYKIPILFWLPVSCLIFLWYAFSMPGPITP